MLLFLNIKVIFLIMYTHIAHHIPFWWKYRQDKIWDVLRDLVPFVQFKKHEKHPWRSVTFSNVAGFSRINSVKKETLAKPATLVTLLHWCFSSFLNCINGTKSRNASQLFRKFSQPQTSKATDAGMIANDWYERSGAY